MKKQTRPELWTDISGRMTVFGHKNSFTNSKGKKDSFIAYQASVSRKFEDGNYINAYIKLRFTKDAGEPEAEGRCVIDVDKGFITCECYTPKDGKEVTVPVIVIQAYSEVDSDELPD